MKATDKKLPPINMGVNEEREFDQLLQSLPDMIGQVLSQKLEAAWKKHLN